MNMQFCSVYLQSALIRHLTKALVVLNVTLDPALCTILFKSNASNVLVISTLNTLSFVATTMITARVSVEMLFFGTISMSWPPQKKLV